MERQFFLLAMWLVTLLGTVWNLVSCFFSCLDYCKIGDIYPAVFSFTKWIDINGFLFQIKNQQQQKVPLYSLQSLWKAVLLYPKYCNCSLNLHNNKYWKPVTLKDRIALFIIIFFKVKCLGIVNILWSIKYLKEVSWEILSQDVTFRKHEVLHMVHNPQDFTSYDSKILYHINKGHLKRPLEITCQKCLLNN